MDPIYGLGLLAVLVFGLAVVRRVARREKFRRYQLHRSLNRPLDMPTTTGRASRRSEMRADDDSTTVMERITKTKPPTGNRDTNTKSRKRRQ
ncbi:MAG: hypothetical protein ABI886_14890 [Betaproteobacteria bacterium]